MLGADASPSGKLVIDTGNASGSTGIVVNNVGGAGASTVSDGIMVVQALNGATTTNGAFALNGRVAAGAYEYFLFRGGVSANTNENWYLRSTLVSGSQPAPVVPDQNLTPEAPENTAPPPALEQPPATLPVDPNDPDPEDTSSPVTENSPEPEAPPAPPAAEAANPPASSSGQSAIPQIGFEGAVPHHRVPRASRAMSFRFIVSRCRSIRLCRLSRIIWH